MSGSNGKDGGLVKSRSKLLRQEEFLREAENAGIKRTITSLCEITGVPISTVYEWFKDEKFTAKWNDVPNKMIRRHLPGVTAAQIHKAIDTADTQSARLLFDVDGKIKQVVEHRGKVELEHTFMKRIETLEQQYGKHLDVPTEGGTSGDRS